MTSSFQEFMRQHTETGSAKADGYSDDVFLGLADDERDIVFNLLIKELPWSAQWIFLVDREKAVKVVMAKESQLRGNGYEHVYLLQQQLVKYTGDLKYQDHMIEDYPAYLDRLKPLVVDSINKTPVNRKTIDFLKKLILVESNVSVVSRASRHLLRSLKVPRDSDFEAANYKQLEEALRSNILLEKQRAFAKIKNYETHLGLRNNLGEGE